MKVLVATARTQGARAGDYHWCVEGELVRIGEICALDRADPGGGCGCGRAFAGLNSHRATTTARVAEVPLSYPDYVEAIRSSLQQQGYEPCDDCADEEADELAELVADWPVGTIVGRRLAELWVRELPTAEPSG
ncbi:DUF7715 family protein [Pseudonocardia acidicola]|uniref:DUF7715 domain-containing protein n=1 Tax=Pseudonocardia acidicola TaxID=2724939 RepID=A0ABX1SB97_9PSEU|nr:hypothetical protein [Pseudonocardia acidicola]NMH98189.1 hypothetical protein [Pseudonocardia acidicola]